MLLELQVHGIHVVHAVHAVHAVNAARRWCTSSKPLKNYPNLLFPYCDLESGIKQNLLCKINSFNNKSIQNLKLREI